AFHWLTTPVSCCQPDEHPVVFLSGDVWEPGTFWFFLTRPGAPAEKTSQLQRSVRRSHRTARTGSGGRTVYGRQRLPDGLAMGLGVGPHGGARGLDAPRLNSLRGPRQVALPGAVDVLARLKLSVEAEQVVRHVS